MKKWPTFSMGAAFLCVFILGCSDVAIVETPGILEASPQEIRFSTTRLNESSQATLLVLETSVRRDVEIRALSVEGTDANAFEIDATLPVVIPRGGQVAWTLIFAPDHVGESSAELKFVANNDIATPTVALFGDAMGADEDNDGWSEDEGDCNDSDGNISPEMEEFCDGTDNDCNNLTDDHATDATMWFTDSDGDGYGNPNTAIELCEAPTGSVLNSADCDDSSSQIYPGAEEICNGLDDDCDGNVDQNAIDLITFYLDSDEDGFGSEQIAQQCQTPDGYVKDSGDCDDNHANIYPGADEYCNQLDDDCDGVVDEDAVDAVIWAEDADDDGYGSGNQSQSCEGGDNSAVIDADHPEDCDDSNTDVHPEAEENCDGNDYNCDGIWSPASCAGCHVIQDDPASLYVTIQDALDAAASGINFGGEIRVCPGTYSENLLFRGAEVMVVGTTPDETVLNGGLCTRGVDRCSVVAFIAGESLASGLKNFTITGGKGTVQNTFQAGGSSFSTGGGIVIYQSSAKLENLVITANQASEGGGVYLHEGSASMSEVTISNHSSAQRGGGVLLIASTAEFWEVSIVANSAIAEGGGIYAPDNPSFSWSGGLLNDNKSSSVGAGAYLSNSTIEFSNLKIHSNECGSSSGGGLYISGGSSYIREVSLEENSVTGGDASQGGGAIHLRSVNDITLVDVQIVNNSSGGYGGGLAISNSSQVALEAVSFRDNNTSTFGGGLHCYHSGNAGSFSLVESEVSANHARYGGGIWSDGCYIQMDRVAHEKNSSDEFGAALYVVDGTLKLYNNLFLSNRASRKGGAMYLVSAAGEIVNNTLSGNYGGERASTIKVEAINSGFRFENNIISHGDGSSIGIEGPSSLASAFLYNNSYLCAVSGFAMDITNLEVDPRFYTSISSTTDDPAEWDLHLQPSSPCINQGIDDESYRDADGSRSDMGAYGGPDGAW